MTGAILSRRDWLKRAGMIGAAILAAPSVLFANARNPSPKAWVNGSTYLVTEPITISNTVVTGCDFRLSGNGHITLTNGAELHQCRIIAVPGWLGNHGNLVDGSPGTAVSACYIACQVKLAKVTP